MEITRHFTATTFVIHQDRVLLHWHRKLNKWLPVGGHIERDELPEAAALREVREEAGLSVKLLGTSGLWEGDGVRELVRPAHILLETINQFHQHIDFIYFARAETEVIGASAEEAASLRWFSREDLLAEPGMPADIIEFSLRALASCSRETCETGSS